MAFRYTPPDFSSLQAGMTRAEVIQRYGKPSRISKAGDHERLAYEWNSAYDMKIGGMWAYVYLIGDKVAAWNSEKDSPPPGF